jgi:hypothetical protein
VTLRDLVAIAFGALLSFAVALAATTNDPTTFLKWGVGFSAALTLVLLVVIAVGNPWMSVHITPLSTTAQTTVLRFGFLNHGRRDYGSVIVNILIPDDVLVADVPIDVNGVFVRSRLARSRR